MRTSFYAVPLETSLAEAVNMAANTYYYPAEAGQLQNPYKNVSLNGAITCGADNTAVVTLEGTNDEDATPANRKWAPLQGYSHGTYSPNSIIAALTCAVSTTILFAWDLDNLNYKYFRVKLVLANPGPGALSNDVNLKLRRTSI